MQIENWITSFKQERKIKLFNYLKHLGEVLGAKGWASTSDFYQFLSYSLSLWSYDLANFHHKNKNTSSEQQTDLNGKNYYFIKQLWIIPRTAF